MFHNLHKIILITLLCSVQVIAFAQQHLLPRANASESSVISLAGDWTLKKDASNVGLSQQWFSNSLGSETIALPTTIDEAGKGTADSRQTGRFTRISAYNGVAWYQKEVTFPEEMLGKRIELVLERTKVTRVWFDDQLVGRDSSYIHSQRFVLTDSLKEKTHRITIRINNGSDEKPPVSGDHSISDGTSTNWNGIIGDILIRATDAVWMEQVQVYPDFEKKVAKIHITFGKRHPDAQAISGCLSLDLQTWNTENPHIYNKVTVPYTIATGNNTFEYTYSLGADAPAWSEFSPVLYRLSATVSGTYDGQPYTQTHETDFGLRQLSVNSKGFAINGKQTFLRGKHDASVFPHTGYPPMDREEWLRILKIYQSYGINHIRCHTWCPPMAALEAGNILGIYWLPELPHWGAVGQKVKVIDGDAEQKTEVYDNTTQYLVSEGNRYLDEMGNQPSFCMFELGNELSGNRSEIENIVTGFRNRDPRHLYANGANCFLWSPTLSSSDDYWITTMTGGSYSAGVYTDTAGKEVRSSYPNHNVGHVNNILCGTDYDYSSAIKGLNVPVISHETGQYQVYPDFSSISKFNGVTRAYNFETYRERLQKAGLGDLADKYFKASGQLAALCYREDIESAIRTKGFGGFELLDLQDYPGQGCALVGMLDAYNDSKGIITPKAWREFCSEVVPLLRHGSWTWTNAETFTSKAQIANYGATDMDCSTSWSIADTTGTILFSGVLDKVTAPQGTVTDLGTISADLSSITKAQKLIVTLSVNEYKNSYPVWVYPAKPDTNVPQDIVVCNNFSDTARKALEEGRKVLILPRQNISTLPTSIDGAYQSDFWNYDMFKKYNPPGTMGILTDPAHPALAEFPTEYHSNWQWWRLLKHGRPIEISHLSATGLKPIVRIIDNFTTNRNLGVLFEAKVGTGSLMICSMNLAKEQNYPEGRQMLHSILKYMESDKFNPSVTLTESQLTTIVSAPKRNIITYKDSIETQKPTQTAFGSDFKLSGKTGVTFDNSHKLISQYQNSSKGYLELTNTYDSLVFVMNKVSSKGSYTSDHTTLYYINKAGNVSSHDYGLFQTPAAGGRIALCLTNIVLPDDIKGIIGVSNTNWSSVLTIDFGEVYLTRSVEAAPGEGDMMVEDGEFTADWNSLSQWTCPKWFKDAKFGIWAHWGPQCQPEHGDWYARKMYYTDQEPYTWHKQHYGDPATFGFKDVIHEWKAEKWDPDSLIKLYKEVGAKYFFALGQHHDNFDLWKSPYQPWNSVNMGPEKDILRGWADACKGNGMKFGVSIHGSHTWTWMEGSQAFDGKLTKEDGKGKWWEGYDPQDLYAQNHALSSGADSYTSVYGQWDWGNGASQPDEAFKKKLLNRTIQMINDYQPDAIYFDDTVLPFYGTDNQIGLDMLTHFYNNSANNHGEQQQVVATGKKLNAEQRDAMMMDYERGIATRIQDEYWQTCTCLGQWHYSQSCYENGYKSASQVIKMMVDVVSKNGNLLLSVPIKGNGTIDDKEQKILAEIKAWLDVNGTSIYATRPWKTFGEGPTADLAKGTAASYSEGQNYTAQDIRYVQRNDTLFATILTWPSERNYTFENLGFLSDYYSGQAKSVSLLGYGDVGFQNGASGLTVTLPEKNTNAIAPVFAITFEKGSVSLPEIIAFYEQFITDTRSGLDSSDKSHKIATMLNDFEQQVNEAKKVIGTGEKYEAETIEALKISYKAIVGYAATVFAGSIENQKPSSETYGENYKLSNKTGVIWDHSNNLFSSRTDLTNGYLQFIDTYDTLVVEMQVVSSTSNYNADHTTLYYVNAAGKLSSHDYGKADLPAKGCRLTFDITENTLPDGIMGLISLTNTNWSSVLTINFGNVYLTKNKVSTGMDGLTDSTKRKFGKSRKYYDLQGHQVSCSHAGIFITEGRTVLKKQ